MKSCKKISITILSIICFIAFSMFLSINFTFFNAYAEETGDKIANSIQVSINEDISLKYYLNIKESDIDDGSLSATFTMGDYDSETTTYTTKDDYIVVVCDKISPQLMGETITATFNYKVGGVETAKTCQTSLKDYFKTLLTSSQSSIDIYGEKHDKLVTLISNILSYGDSSQLYTEYNTDTLVTSYFEGVTLTATDYSSLQTDDLPQSKLACESLTPICWKKANINFSSTNSLNFVFTVIGESGDLKARVTKGESSKDFTVTSEGKIGDNDAYSVCYDEILATEYDEAITVQIMQNNGDGYVNFGSPITYSINSYLATIIENANSKFSQEMVDLAKATYLYGLSAKNYIKTDNPTSVELSEISTNYSSNNTAQFLTEGTVLTSTFNGDQTQYSLVLTDDTMSTFMRVDMSGANDFVAGDKVKIVGTYTSSSVARIKSQVVEKVDTTTIDYDSLFDKAVDLVGDTDYSTIAENTTTKNYGMSLIKITNPYLVYSGNTSYNYIRFGFDSGTGTTVYNSRTFAINRNSLPSGFESTFTINTKKLGSKEYKNYTIYAYLMYLSTSYYQAVVVGDEYYVYDRALSCDNYMQKYLLSSTSGNLSTVKSYFSTLTSDEQKNMKYYDEYSDMLVTSIDKAIASKTTSSSLKTDYQTLIKNIAYQYKYQGTQIQYDQYNERRNAFTTPMYASADRTAYLDCSSFVSAVYNYAFGIDITRSLYDNSTLGYILYAKQHCKDNGYGYTEYNDILYYVMTKNYTTESAQDALLAEIKSNLQVGDVIIYRHGTDGTGSGHVMIYIGGTSGSEKFIHCTGTGEKVTAGTTNPAEWTDDATDDESSTGAILVSSASQLFTRDMTKKRYLFNDGSVTASNKVGSFAVLRPLNRTDLALNEEALKSATSYLLESEKTSTKTTLNSVECGDSLTFTITTNNKSSSVSSEYYITESLPQEFEFLSATNCGVYSKSKHAIYWEHSALTGSGSASVSYTVKVKTGLTNGTVILDDGGYVNGVPMNSIKYSVKSDFDCDEFYTYACSFINSEQTSGFDFIKACYKAFNKNALYGFSSTGGVLRTLLAYQQLVTTCTLYNYITEDFYGGVTIANKMGDTDNNRLRLVKAEYLECGDSIYLGTTYGGNGEVFTEYLYLSNSLILAVKDGVVVEAYNTQDTVSQFLETIVAYNRFVIIRPSLVE